MTNSMLSRYAGWSALASAIATILGLVTLIMFFTLGEPWGIINDITSMVLSLTLLPVLFVLHLLYRDHAPMLSLAAFIIGALAMLIASTVQTLLVIKLIAFSQTAVIVPVAFGLFGGSLIVYGGLARMNKTMPRQLVSLSIIAGTGYIGVITGFIVGGPQHPLAAIGGLLAVICYPIWAIWFGRLLSSGKLTT